MGTLKTKRNVTLKKYGLTELYSSDNPMVDIVFVHGLNGSSYNTWATTKKPDVFWPSDLLPQALQDLHVRILTYGYDAKVATFMDGASKEKLHNHAEHLVGALVANRNLSKTSENPIIFVCHSLGGLVVKKALSYSARVRNEKTLFHRAIYISTFGILFLGTPHNGADVAKLGSMLQSIISMVVPTKFVDSSAQLVHTLKSNNEHLQNINREFVQIMNRFHIYFFHESKPMDLGGSRVFIVDESSAAPIFDGVERMGIEADHGAMVRFVDANSPGYEPVTEAIHRYASEAPALISARWQQEYREREQAKVEEARQQFGISVGNGESIFTVPFENLEPIGSPMERSHSSMTGSMIRPPQTDAASQMDTSVVMQKKDEFVMVIPPGFHPNAVFFGMEEEIKQLHTILLDETNRKVAVVIYGGPGAGKSHLAREFMYANLHRYPGGVFWIDGKTKESRLQCIWEIALASSIMQDGQSTPDPRWLMPDQYAGNVRKWLEARDQWLVVFDGLAFECEEDLDEFKKFLPFKQNSSIIYTSVDPTLRQKQRLFEPIGLQVKPLSVEAACQLLFRDIGINKPTSEQIRKARELVRYYECLPLAIHALGHRLNATQKPLEKFHAGSHLTDVRLAEPYQGIMADLEANNYLEALNLINILSFFGHHVPVGMIHMGCKALADSNHEIRTADRHTSIHRDIENTFAILIKYGLIDRSFDPYLLNDQGPSPTAESPAYSQSSCQEPRLGGLRSSIDVIKIHSVVQDFCRDELKIGGLEQFCAWLAIATRLFCFSYSNATHRIKVTRGSGLVRDYREYQTHAERLLRHFPSNLDNTAINLLPHYESLREVIHDIEEEIKNRSPGSSQSTLRNQKSIFDHTSSMSSISGSFGDDSFKSWEQEVEYHHTDSPVETELPSGLHRVDVQDADRQTIALSDDGEYDDANVTVQMSPSASNNTEVPTPKLNPEEETGWQDVKHKKKRPSFISAVTHRWKRLRDRKNLGEFRPAAKITPSGVYGKGNPSSTAASSPIKPTVASDAKTALAKMHHTSLPLPRRSASKAKENRPTYASVVASQDPSQQLKPPSPQLNSPPQPDHTGLTSSPASLPQDPNAILSMSAYSDPGQTNTLDASSPLHLSPPRRPHHKLSNLSQTSYQSTGTADLSSRAVAANSRPLPYERDIQVVPGPRVSPPSNISGTQRDSFSFPALHPVSSRGSLPSSGRPWGYSSQPMSRDNSHQSQQSLRTEPTRRLSPWSGNRPTSFSQLRWNDIVRYGPGARGLAMESREHAIESGSSSPVSLEGHPLTKTASGPGIMVESRDGMSRSLIEFGSNMPQHIQFGELEPVNIMEARQRSAQSLLLPPHGHGQPFQQPQTSQAPYPDFNLMPTASNPDQLAMMVAQAQPQSAIQAPPRNRDPRMRSGSTPARPDWNGLGIYRQRY
ncbi:hypothetical protein FQN57_000375 [Myotisia sp. PD_48]|nr:hypothetical protein FQN57_000375 [Myotisia sp. PD_48]